MFDFLFACFGWAPPEIQVMAFGVISIFVVVAVVRVITLILDLLPWR